MFNLSSDNDYAMDDVRESYDSIAGEYARRLFQELDGKPLDRELLGRFATDVASRGEVCDMGCGPGHVARFLRERGADVFGLDISPRMIDAARALNPGITFRVGDMLALDLAGETLAGIAAFYAIVNIPDALLPSVFREFARVLRPDGRLLLAFHAGEDVVRKPELWGVQLSIDFYYFQPELIVELLEAAGFAIDEVVRRGPYAPEVEHQSHRAYIFARKPGRTGRPSS